MNILTAFNSAANQYLKFAIVGFFGTIINLLVFYCLFNIFNTNLNVASVFAFIIACANNFILNFLWTFKNTNLIASSQKKLFMYFKYLSVNLIGLLLNLLILNFVVHTFGDSVALMGQLAGILLGSISNFFFSRKLVF
jgi:putative flippase GtrA